MILVASRGEAFEEPFSFKNDTGQAVAAPSGTWTLTLTRGDFVKDFAKLPVLNHSVIWRMTADETTALRYNNLSFSLALNGQVVVQGVLRVK